MISHTIGSLLAKAGFSQDTGSVIFQWTIEFLEIRHAPDCLNTDNDDWCDCPRLEKVIRRKVINWKSPLFNTPIGYTLGGGSYGIIQEDHIPKERHRTIELDMIAEDANAVYILESYDGDQWIRRIPKSGADILKNWDASFNKYEYEEENE